VRTPTGLTIVLLTLSAVTAMLIAVPVKKRMKRQPG